MMNKGICVNHVTREIMEVLGIGVHDAIHVQAVLDESDIDYSECTEKQLHCAFRNAYINLANMYYYEDFF
jgi:hypothetical protein